MAKKLKCWKKNYPKNRFEKNGEIVQVGGYIVGKGTKAERKVYWVVHGKKPAKITHGFPTKESASKFAVKYMKKHDVCKI